MITRFFKTSKPHHYFIFILIVLGGYVFHKLRLFNNESQSLNFVNESFSFLALIVSLFLVVFIITKNNLTRNNSFAAAYFCLFTVLIPEVFSNHNILISNLFVLLAFRRIFSINTGLNLKKKYFDATLWVCVAAFFSPLAILYFIPILISVIFNQLDKIKHIMIIGLGVVAIATLGLTFNLLFKTPLPWQKFTKSLIGFNFSTYNNPILLGTIALFITLSVWAILTLFNKRISNSKTRYLFLILILIQLVGVTIPIISAPKSPDQLLFLFFPTSILFANISERSNSKWISEITMTILLLLIVAKLASSVLGIPLLY